MKISKPRKHATRLIMSLISGLMGLALACNFSPLTAVPPTSAPTALTPVTSPVVSSSLPPTLPPPTSTPTDTPTPTISPCADDATVRTEGCDEFTPQLSSVSHFDRSGESRSACQGWCQLGEGDSLETNDTGQAELNFSDCWPGRLFLYQTSIAQALVSTCTKADFCPGGNCSNPPVICVPNGALYADKCAGEFNPVTGSTRIEKNTASYLITYNKDDGNVTTIIVTDGTVQLRPVLQYNPLRLGDPMEITSGHFVFTMPDETLTGVAGLEPRTVHSVEQLPQVVEELGLQDWVIEAAQNARDGGYLPENWPAELSGRGMVVRADGGALSNLETQIWIYRAMNWSDLPVSDRQIRLLLPDQTVNAFDMDYVPARSASILTPQKLAIKITFSVEDEELGKSAAVIAEYLKRAGVAVALTPVQPGQLAALIKEYETNKIPYLSLTR